LSCALSIAGRSTVIISILPDAVTISHNLGAAITVADTATSSITVTTTVTVTVTNEVGGTTSTIAKGKRAFAV
jgi:hypothetical protein